MPLCGLFQSKGGFGYANTSIANRIAVWLANVVVISLAVFKREKEKKKTNSIEFHAFYQTLACSNGFIVTN